MKGGQKKKMIKEITEENEQKNIAWKACAIVFIVAFVASCFVGITNVSNLKKSLCKPGEYGICWNASLSTVSACDIARNEIAKCVSSDYTQWVTCKNGFDGICMKEGRYEVWNGTNAKMCFENQKAYCGW